MGRHNGNISAERGICLSCQKAMGAIERPTKSQHSNRPKRTKTENPSEGGKISTKILYRGGCSRKRREMPRRVEERGGAMVETSEQNQGRLARTDGGNGTSFEGASIRSAVR